MTEHLDASWSVREFDGLNLGDAHLNRRLLTLAEAFGAHPQAPINQASADWQDTNCQGADRTIVAWVRSKSPGRCGSGRGNWSHVGRLMLCY